MPSREDRVGMRERIDILIVDDREENLFVLESILDDNEYNIVKAFSGKEALSLALTHEFALILLDVQMPEMDGYETANLLQGIEKTKDIPVIFITALSKEKEYIFRGYESGAVDYLPKPIDPVILKTKVRIFVELYRSKRSLHEKAVELEEKVGELTLLKGELEKANRKLEGLSSIDGLTGIPNRRKLDEFIDMEWRRGARNRYPVSFIMVDIDFFKNYNDNYGHLEGDNCLRKVAYAIGCSAKRPGDLVARYGGEEFGVVLGETNLEGAMVVAEKIRSGVENLSIEHGYSPVSDRVTVSVGVASALPERNSTADVIISAADNALYLSKNEGRNRIKKTYISKKWWKEK